jgi:hypothetical protein
MFRANFLTIFLLSQIVGKGQSIKPYILNMGGGAGTSSSAQAIWSIGESSMIGSFSSSSLQFNAGILQPNIDVVTSLPNLGSKIFGNQITISPNPSYDDIQIKFNMNVTGTANVSIYNTASQLVKAITIKSIAAFQLFTYKLNDLPSGSFFLKLNYQSLNGKSEEGTYKIIRL